MSKIFLILLAIIALAAGAMMVHWILDRRWSPTVDKNSSAPAEEITQKIKQVTYLPYPDYPRQITQTGDHSILRLIPPAELQVGDKNLFPAGTLSIKSFYMSETPVTNQQYVDFLNSVIDRVQVKESDVYLNDLLVLKLSEKIRGYKPIVFEKGRFAVKDPMHSACALLFVTGFGAEAYARHYSMRLPSSWEWFFVRQTGNGKRGVQRMPLPTPVINYDEDKYGMRGINQMAEWGKNRKGEFVILGQAPSEMVAVDLIENKNPTKYYTDTGFRVAKNLP